MNLNTILNPLEEVASSNGAFSLKTLISCEALEEKRKYCNNHLRVIGNGSSRIVYEYKTAVLKLAMDDAGIAQNATEAKIAESGVDCVTQVYQVGPKNAFLISEMAFSEPSHGTFKAITGMLHNEFYAYVLDYYTAHIEDHKNPERYITKSQFRANYPPIYFKHIKNNPLTKEVIFLMKNYGLQPGDLTLRNLGQVERNRKYHIVIVDSGFNKQVADEFYRFGFKAPKLQLKSADK